MKSNRLQELAGLQPDERINEYRNEPGNLDNIIDIFDEISNVASSIKIAMGIISDNTERAMQNVINDGQSKLKQNLGEHKRFVTSLEKDEVHSEIAKFNDAITRLRRALTAASQVR